MKYLRETGGTRSVFEARGHLVRISRARFGPQFSHVRFRHSR